MVPTNCYPGGLVFHSVSDHLAYTIDNKRAIEHYYKEAGLLAYILFRLLFTRLAL
jgi:hypothetical protein